MQDIWEWNRLREDIQVLAIHGYINPSSTLPIAILLEKAEKEKRIELLELALKLIKKEMRKGDGAYIQFQRSLPL